MGAPSTTGRAVARAATRASADPAEPSTGPQLTLETLRAHAADAGKPLGAYVAESILVPGAYAAPGYVSGVMQPPRGLTALQVEDLVSYLIGKPWTSPAAGPLKLPAKPIAACEAKASCRATVARWAKAERLPASVLAGAKIVAISGCLSCHRYAGSGVRSGSAPELTRVGLGKTTVAAHVRRLRCPTCVRAGLRDAVLRGARRRQSAPDRRVPAGLARNVDAEEGAACAAPSAPGGSWTACGLSR